MPHTDIPTLDQIYSWYNDKKTSLGVSDFLWILIIFQLQEDARTRGKKKQYFKVWINQEWWEGIRRSSYQSPIMGTSIWLQAGIKASAVFLCLVQLSGQGGQDPFLSWDVC